MKKILIILIMLFSFFNNTSANYSKLAYDHNFIGIRGEVINLSDYKNKIIIVVNVASRCGFTGQYEDLQKLWETYRNKDIIIIGVPTNNFNQEPGTNEDIKTFCETTFGVSFLMTQKLNVLGDDAHPFYKWAKENHGNSAVPKWNFHKIIIGKDGKVNETFTSITNPSSTKFIKYIEKQIKN